MKLSSNKSASVYRTRPLPTGSMIGKFLVAEPLIAATRSALESVAVAGIHNRGHEGMAFWAGRSNDAYTAFLQVIVPRAEHGHSRVHASREAVGEAARVARQHRLGILCQVHSHPGDDTRHSDGDDDLVLFPFEGMLSVVVPNFGIGFTGIEQCSVHQFQQGRWTLCDHGSVVRGMMIVPTEVDLRGKL